MEETTQHHKFSIETSDFKIQLYECQKQGLFTDCTIAASCGESVDVHKVVLASCSEYLANLLTRRHADPNPVLVFANVQFDDLLGIVELIYTGNVTIREDQLNGFVIAIVAFQIQGVYRTESSEPVKLPDEEVAEESEKEEAQDVQMISKEIVIAPSGDGEIPVKASKQKQAKALRQKQNAGLAVLPPDKSSTVVCNFCGKATRSHNIYRHKKECALNPNRVIYKCKFCSKTFVRKCTLSLHEKTHEPQGSESTAKKENVSPSYD